jgi:Fe-S cluster assembly ATP-binding protein
MLKINNLNGKVANKVVVKNFNLTINPGEIHVVMGPNGAGKSSLASLIMGNPEYEITDGTINFLNHDITELEADQRARLGIFMAFQYPIEIPGITTDEFIYNSLQARQNKDDLKLSDFAFDSLFEESKKSLKMPDDLSNRHLNVGFSGGEKKRNEIFQMKMLKPRLAVLDEIDSGLDVDALRIVGENINSEIIKRPNDFSVLIITHYRRLLDYIEPDFIHIMKDGELIGTGNIDLINDLEENGFENLDKERISAICSHVKVF